MIPDLPKYSKDVKDLIRGMLAVDEDKRFSWDQISKHDWIVKPVCEDNSLLLIKDAFSNLDIADEKV
jgi:serine/threonine protein kinase